MRNLLLVSFFLFCTFTVRAQSVLLPNGDFENYNNISGDNPSAWFTSNDYTIPSLGAVSVKKVAGKFSNYAVRLETVSKGNKTQAGAIRNSMDVPKGVPFTFKPIWFKGTYRYNLQTNDTALIFVVFKKNGSVISDNQFRITGSQATAIDFSFNIQPMLATPDSVFIMAMSGNQLSGVPIAGSWIELDDFSFDDNTLWVPAPNGDFENWSTKAYAEVTDWFYEGHEATLTTDKHTGNSAIKLVSADKTSTDLHLTPVAPLPSGMPYTKKNDTLTGYYKYTSVNGDEGSVTVTLFDKNNTPIIVQPAGMFSTLKLTATNTYTYFEIPLPADDTPSHMNVQFSSSASNLSAQAGSTLFIDNLRLKNTTVSINDITQHTKIFAVYPNPAKSTLYIQPSEQVSDNIDVKIYDITGKLLHSVSHPPSRSTISISIRDFATGVYHYEISRGDVNTKGIFVKE